MKTSPFKERALTENSTGIGTVTRKMVRQRAVELAATCGRSPQEDLIPLIYPNASLALKPVAVRPGKAVAKWARQYSAHGQGSPRLGEIPSSASAVSG